VDQAVLGPAVYVGGILIAEGYASRPDHGWIKIYEQRHFQARETGLPQWVKHSADEREKINDAAELLILIIINDNRPKRTASISCL
jgi:hypothetical protein